MAIVELMEFALKKDANEEKYLHEARRIISVFTSKQPGFIKGSLVKSDEGKFMYIIYWESRKHAEGTVERFRTRRDDMKVFTEYIDPDSIKAEYTNEVIGF